MAGRTKRNWIKTAHYMNTRVAKHTHILLCGYGLSGVPQWLESRSLLADFH